MANTVIKKRTIQHPGFEFLETDMSIYKEFVQATDALIVGYFAKGPINQPLALKNLQDYTSYFGQPETEAEYYAYKGIYNVIDNGGTVTAVRLPYDNSEATISAEGLTLNYKAITGVFEEADTSTLGDILAAYETAPTIKQINLSQKVLTQDDLVEIIGGTSATDFAIINKNNDFLTKDGSEIFVTVLGAANAIRYQGLEDETVTDGVEDIMIYNQDEVLTEDSDKALWGRERIKWQTNGEISDDGELLTVADSLDDTFLPWYPTIPTYSVLTDSEETVYVDPRKDDKIAVIVSKIVPSTLEAGKFRIEVVESYAGSIFKDSVDPISKESDYIGDLINNDSAYINFYGKSKYSASSSAGYEESDVAIVMNSSPMRLSWVDGGLPYSTASSASIIKPILLKKDSVSSLNLVEHVIKPALKKVKNNVNFLYRDVYDCGLTSVVAYAHEATSNDVINGIASETGDMVYDPTVTDPTETSSTSFLNAGLWKKTVLAFARHCRFNHKFSMFHADGPRKLPLNGNLSRTQDLHQDEEEVVFTAKKVQVVSIKDNTYCQVNTQWYKVSDEINSRTMWLPTTSTILTKALTYNDINSNVWDAPAGRRYAKVSEVLDIAFNPEYETMDRLYLNCLNYGSKYPDGVMTVEGQKTSYAETSALNRINVRRLMIWLERYVEQVAQTWLYEPNNATNRAAFARDVEIEFNRCLSLGGVTAYRIVCDESNNPPEVVDRNEMRITCFVTPARTTEYIISNFVITKTGANLEELSAAF